MANLDIKDTIVIAQLLKEYHEELIKRLSGVYVQAGSSVDRLPLIQANAKDIQDLQSKKVDKISGKGLSTNDFTTILRQKLIDIEDGAEKNVQSDWNETDTTKSSFIKNKPNIQPYNDSAIWTKFNNLYSYDDTNPDSILFYTKLAGHLKMELVSTLPSITDGEYNTLYVIETKDSKNNRFLKPYVKMKTSIGFDEYIPLMQTINYIKDSLDQYYIQQKIVTSLPTLTAAKPNILYILKEPNPNQVGSFLFTPYMLIDGALEPVGVSGSNSGQASFIIVSTLPQFANADLNTIYFLKRTDSQGNTTFTGYIADTTTSSLVPFSGGSGGVGATSHEIVTTLPSYSTADKNKIYFLKQSDGQGGFTYTGYVVDDVAQDLVPFSGGSGGGTGAFAFNVDNNGDLILYYTNGTAPNATINTAGDLILTIN